MSTLPMPKALADVIDDFSNSLFWTMRAIENCGDMLEDLAAMHEADMAYESAGYPLGKSIRGFKKWKKQKWDVLDAKIIR